MLISRDSFAKYGVFAVLLSGCVSSNPPPSPAMQQLMAACEQGNVSACQSLAADEAARRQEAIALAQAMRIEPMDATPFLNRPAPQAVLYNGPWTYCMNGTRVPYGQYCPI
jgi:hypothetical protein